MNFRLTTDQLEDGTAVLTVAGEADLYTAPELKEELLGVIEAGASNVIVDLTDASFVDSTTLGVLISAVKRLQPQGGEVPVVVSDPNIRKVFEITLLDRVFPLFDAREPALAHVSSALRR